MSTGTTPTPTVATTAPVTVYLPEPFLPDDLRGRSRATGMTVYLNTGTSPDTVNDELMFAAIHVASAADAESVGWDISSFPIYGPDGAAAAEAHSVGRRGWWVYATEGSVLRTVCQMRRAQEELAQKITRLSSALDAERELRVDAGARHAQDLEKISEALMEEAENRDWCSEYDQFVDGLNAQLHGSLAEREREFTVEVEVIYTFTETVTARSEDDARSLIEDDGEDRIDHDRADRWSYQSASVEAVSQN